MSKNNEWARIEQQTVPAILKMLEWETRDGIVCLPETAHEFIENWRKSVESYRKNGLDHLEGEETATLLGKHENMSSPGKIILCRENIGRCFWVCISDLLSVQHKITPIDLGHLCEAAVFKTFTHEQFHHYCDVINRITKQRGMKQAEEALAVAWSWHEVQRSLPTAQKLPPSIFQASLSWWYDSITALGYRDWKNFGHKHFFIQGLVHHLIASDGNHLLIDNGCDLGYWLYKMMENPDWCADAVRYSVVDRNGKTETHSETNQESSIASADLKSCLEGMRILVANGKVSVNGDLILCDEGLSSLHDIHETVHSVSGSICLQDNPIKSHVLGLLKIKDLKSVILDNKKIESIINKHLKGSRDIFDTQNELMDAGFGDFAQL